MSSVKNISMGIAGKILNLFLEFFVRTVFIYTLSQEFLGISGLFTSVLSVLNLSELGIGTAIVYALYKPLAEKNTEKIHTLMRFYKKAYFIIGCVILTMGLLLMPVLPYFMNGTTDIINIYHIFLLYLLQTVSSYWFFAHKSALLLADQKGYIVSAWQNIFYIFRAIIRIIFLLFFRETPVFSFYLYTLIGAVFNIFVNVIVARHVDKDYPYINYSDCVSLGKEEKKSIFKNVYALTFSNISSIVNNSADALIISTFIGITATGIYSNYELIVSSISGLIWIVVTSLIPSIGNLIETESVEKRYFIFRCINLLFIWIYGFTTICIWILITPFIGGIWLNSDYVLSQSIVFVVIMNFLTGGLLSPFNIFMDAAGIYWQRRHAAIMSVITNIICSVLFVTVFNLGIAGVIFATIISRLLIIVPTYPRLVFNNVFDKSVKLFYFQYILSILSILGIGISIHILCIPFRDLTLINFVIKLIFCMVIPNLICLVIFRKTDEFIYLRQMIIVVLNKTISKKRNLK